MQKDKTGSIEPTTLGAGGHFRIKDMFRLKMPCADESPNDFGKNH
ncbi:hypothetical protein [Klebsiella pneumoniae]|nr:hypothetical protein [Klebsiella pneumoniae]